MVLVGRFVELEDDFWLEIALVPELVLKLFRVLRLEVGAAIEVIVAIGATKTTLGIEDWMINVAVIVPCVLGSASSSPLHILYASVATFSFHLVSLLISFLNLHHSPNGQEHIP